MYGVGVAEEVMHVTQNLLIGTYKEHAEIIGLVLLECMNGQRMSVMEIGGEVSNLTITVAGDVLNGGIAGGALVESLDGHDGEYLINGP